MPLHILRLITGSKYRESTMPRLGFQKIPKFSQEDKVFWFHSVSVGETQVAATLIKKIKEKQPDAKIVVSTATETGQAIARKIEGVDASFYYPIDFSFLINSMIKKLKPTAMIVVETDIWLSFVNHAHLKGIPLYLVNGKISERTLASYQKRKFIPKLLIAPFDHFFVQSEEYSHRFNSCGIEDKKISIVGNVKLDSSVPLMNEQEQVSYLLKHGLDKSAPIVVFGSTHAGEEELAVDCYKKLRSKLPGLQCVLVPRHPERFQGVADMLKASEVDYNRSSEIEGEANAKDFLLVDEMGQLMKYYQVCTLAIVAGSFTPHVGGHNILEPSFYGKPFVCGPYLYKQPGFDQLNKQYKAGEQCTAEELPTVLEELLLSDDRRSQLGLSGQKIIATSKGAAQRISAEILSELNLS